MYNKSFLKTVGLWLLIIILNGILIKSNFAFYQPEYQNRGSTTFLDAYVSPGSVFQVYVLNFKSNELRLGSKEAPGKFKLSANTYINQFVYISKKKIMGSYLGGEIIVPVVSGHLRLNKIRSKDHGIGDIFIAGLLQTDRKMLCLGKYQIPSYFRFLAGVALPTGEYDHSKSFNVGNNLHTFTLYCSNTFFITPKWELSSRFMYNFHTTNNDFGPYRDNLRPGQLFNVNFAASYPIWENIRLGITGYYWRQTTDDIFNGNNIRGRELAFALGPGIVIDRVIAKKKFIFITHALFDNSVKNRPQGTTVQGRLIVLF